MPNPVTVRYPLQPLADALGLALDTPGLARRLNLSGTTWKEYRDLGVSERVADRLACKAGLHPYTVWPEMADAHLAELETPCADPTCDQTFQKVEWRQKYCSPECRQRTNSRDHNRRRYQNDPEYREAKKAASRQATKELWESAPDAVKRRETARKRKYHRAFYERHRERLLAEKREQHRAKKGMKNNTDRDRPDHCDSTGSSPSIPHTDRAEVGPPPPQGAN
jgi:hypothetical protein